MGNVKNVFDENINEDKKVNNNRQLADIHTGLKSSGENYFPEMNRIKV